MTSNEPTIIYLEELFIIKTHLCSRMLKCLVIFCLDKWILFQFGSRFQYGFQPKTFISQC